MNGATTIQERLKDLRLNKRLKLEELAEQKGISKSALGSYEKDDYKESNHGNLILLADFYGDVYKRQLFILFFYFSVVLVVIREKSPEIRDFPRQPARQRDSNRGCNGLSFSEWKLHLFCDLHKTVHLFFRRVAGVRCRVFTLPALLPAIFGKHSWIREVPPAVNALVHYLVDFPDFPLLRFVKGMV